MARDRLGRSIEDLLQRMSPLDGPVRVRDVVKRPTVAAYRRNQSLTPQERLDNSFALLAFARSLRVPRG